MPQFDLSTFPGQMFWLMLVFALQYLIILKLIVPAFKTLFNKRKNYLDKQLKEAEDFSKKAEQLRLDYEKRLEKIKEENVKLFNKTSDEIKIISEIQLSRLEDKFLKEVRKQEEKLKQEYENIDVEIDNAAIDLAANLLNKVTSVKTNKKKLLKYL